jgi:serine/threonine-protein kinase RsbW
VTTPAPSLTPDAGSLDLQHDRAEVDRAVGAVLRAADRHGYSEASKFAVRLALEEALSNAFRHGHRDLPGTPVHLEYRVAPTRATIVVEDRGPGFDPAAVPDPTLDENLELPCGRGLMLMRAYMTTVAFNARGNRVTMDYVVPAPGRSR